MGARTDLGTVGNDLWSNTHVSIWPLKNESDLIYAACDLQHDDKQKELVTPAWFSGVRAYLFREVNYPCIRYDEQMTLIGFITLCK